jgi:hypothetical protein
MRAASNPLAVQLNYGRAIFQSLAFLPSFLPFNGDSDHFDNAPRAVRGLA